ncbi:MAG: hypothetical protein JNJ47_07590 [Alphaproteobacteria bacterium]|nr:hypothetical protein [Alphaproteobacteria bacterium]
MAPPPGGLWDPNANMDSGRAPAQAPAGPAAGGHGDPYAGGYMAPPPGRLWDPNANRYREGAPAQAPGGFPYVGGRGAPEEHERRDFGG